jgi:hypothetical protein
LKNLKFRFTSPLLFTLIVTLALFVPACTKDNISPRTQNSTTSSSASVIPASSNSTSNPNGAPEEAKGQDPEDFSLCPGSIRTAFLEPTCVCSSAVTGWYAVTAKPDVVLNYYVTELKQSGWAVNISESTAYKLFARGGAQGHGIIITCYKSSQWKGFDTEMTLEWIPPDREAVGDLA